MSSNRSSSPPEVSGDETVGSREGYRVESVLALLVVGVERRLKLRVSVMRVRLKDWEVGENMRACSVEG